MHYSLDSANITTKVFRVMGWVGALYWRSCDTNMTSSRCCFQNHSHSHHHFSSHHTVLAKSPTCSSSLHRSSHSHHCFQNYSHSHRHFSSHPHTHQHFTVINNKPSCPHKSHATTTVQFLAFFQFELQCAMFLKEGVHGLKG